MGSLRGRRLWLVLTGVAVVVIAAIVVVLSSNGSRPPGGERAGAGTGAGERAEAEDRGEREKGYLEPRKEAKFERTTGEADRKGPKTPAAEQVENRAIPRSYVDDKRAIASRKA